MGVVVSIGERTIAAFKARVLVARFGLRKGGYNAPKCAVIDLRSRFEERRKIVLAERRRKASMSLDALADLFRKTYRDPKDS